MVKGNQEGIKMDNNNEKTATKKKLSPRVILTAAGIVLLLLVLFRIFGTKEKIVTDPLSTVSVGHPEYSDISNETSLIGTVMPGDVYYVIPKASGEITEIFVATGDKVKAGDPVCTIDNSKAVDSAAISLKSAQDAVALARTNLDRMAALLQTGDISKQAYESTKNGYDQAVAALEGAQLQYDTQVEFSTVTAPVDGKVESVNMSINGLASPQSQVCVISSDGENKITINVTDRLLGAFLKGTELKVTKQGSEYAAKVTSVSSLPSSTTGLYPVEAVFTEANSIPNGSSIKVTFVSESSEHALSLDTDAVQYDGGSTYVYTISYNDENDDLGGKNVGISENNRLGTVHKVEVETGMSDNNRTEILNGIDENSLVIMSWTSQLYEGAQVQVLPEE